CSAVDRQIPAMVDGEVTGIQMLVLRQVRTAVKLDVSRRRIPPSAKDDLIDAGEVPRMGNLNCIGDGGIAGWYVGIVPKEIEDGQGPFLCGEAAVAQKPGRIWILETMDSVA